MKNSLKYVYVIVFMILITSIGFLTICGFDSTSKEVFMHYEKRMPAGKPGLDFRINTIKTICLDYEKYINDNFSLRSQLIKAISKMYQSIGVSIKPGKGLYGKNGFLFLGNEFNRVIDQVTGKITFTKNELSEWNECFEQRREYIEKQGAKLYVCIAPNKHSIYPEHLPGYIKPVKNNSLQQILSCSKNYNLISPLDSLLKTKSYWGDLLYYKTGTHWSFIGAYICYLEILKEISKDFPEIKAINLAKPNFNVLRNISGSDIPRLLYIKSMNDFNVEVLKSSDWTDDLIKTNYSGDTLFVSSLEKVPVKEKCIIYNPLRKKTLLLLKDSFSSWLAPFLNQTFGKIIYCHYEQTEGIELTQIVERFKPDIVLYEISERKLHSKQYLHPNIITKSHNNELKRIQKIDLKKFSERIIRTNQIKDLTIQEDGLHFVATGKDPFLILSAINSENDNIILVKIDFTTPQNSTSQLFYKTNSDQHFSRKRSISIKVKKGLNVSYYQVPENALSFISRFDPGTSPGNYIIHTIELFENK